MKAGAIFGVLIILFAALSLLFVISAPTTTASAGLVDPTGIHPTHYYNVTLWADASGWDYNHGPTNPTMYFQVCTKVNFTVIEEDNLPHTLTINAGPNETSSTLTLLTTSDITQTPGHVSKANYTFFKSGEYTYWCTVHPTTMVGHIFINATSNSTSSSVVKSSSVHSNLLNNLESNTFNAIEKVKDYTL
ncbi:cupredoxin domain-containing protein [Caldiplasma sukawensis]